MPEKRFSEDHNRRVVANFDDLGEEYDSIRHMRAPARRLVERAAPQLGAQVLDIATGTGWAAMAAAECVGPTGWVLGVDLASELLELARKKVVAAGSAHVEFREGDAQRLDLGDSIFDVVLCASSLFLIPDMLAALREWHRVLKPGGQVVFSGFGPTLLKPLIDLWRARLQQYVGSPPSRRWTQRLAEPDKCLHLLHEAGFEQCEVRNEQLGYLLTAEEWWEELMSSA